jgi:hypothetical protein
MGHGSAAVVAGMRNTFEIPDAIPMADLHELLRPPAEPAAAGPLEEDGLAPARGICVGLAAGLICWLLIAVAVWGLSLLV